MKIKLLPPAVAGLAGLVTAGLIALPGSAGATDFAKRDEDSADVVLVSDDDDENDDDDRLARDDTSRSRSRTGSRSGRDNSRNKRVKDWTRDGTNSRKRDWSQNRTNDRSRHNTR